MRDFTTCEEFSAQVGSALNEGECITLIQRWDQYRDKSREQLLPLLRCYRSNSENTETLLGFLFEYLSIDSEEIDKLGLGKNRKPARTRNEDTGENSLESLVSLGSLQESIQQRTTPSKNQEDCESPTVHWRDDVTMGTPSPAPRLGSNQSSHSTKVATLRQKNTNTPQIKTAPHLMSHNNTMSKSSDEPEIDSFYHASVKPMMVLSRGNHFRVQGSSQVCAEKIIREEGHYRIHASFTQRILKAWSPEHIVALGFENANASFYGISLTITEFLGIYEIGTLLPGTHRDDIVAQVSAAGHRIEFDFDLEIDLPLIFSQTRCRIKLYLNNTAVFSCPFEITKDMLNQGLRFKVLSAGLCENSEIDLRLNWISGVNEN